MVKATLVGRKFPIKMPESTAVKGVVLPIMDWADRPGQGVIKRCRLSLLTNSAPRIRVQFGGMGGVAVSQPISTAVQIT